ncbi:MAG: flagellar biosynthesis anti-sigma factor FlgM [Lachnospiraceae bacterium]|nr:flagellar biosynthesis anti-sigma factor FlgM [Lachnospiraceae bacterium]
MRIDSMNTVNSIYKTNSRKKINNAYQTSFSDKLEISQLGRDLQIAKKAVSATSDVREDKVEAMKTALANGYSVSDSDIADKLLEGFAL